MYLFVILVAMPIGFGIYGLRRGILPVSSKRFLRDAHAKRYSIAFIAIPVFFMTLASAFFFVLPIWTTKETGSNAAFYLLIIALPLTLAIVLNRATKLARRLMIKNPQYSSAEKPSDSLQAEPPALAQDLNPYSPPCSRR